MTPISIHTIWLDTLGMGVSQDGNWALSRHGYAPYAASPTVTDLAPMQAALRQVPPADYSFNDPARQTLGRVAHLRHDPPFLTHPKRAN